jgi:hypothetical protein
MAQKKLCSKRARVPRVTAPCAPRAETPAAPRDVLSTIRGAELAIIDGIIAIAKKGSYQHAKFLFDYAGLSHQPTAPPEEPSFAQVLLERLGMDEEFQRERENSDDVGNQAATLVNGGARS